jgi:DNA recombination protein RmuC
LTDPALSSGRSSDSPGLIFFAQGRFRPAPGVAFSALVILLALILFLAVVAAAALWPLRTLRSEVGALRSEASAQLAERSAESARRTAELAALDRRLEGIDGRLLASQRASGQTATQIAEKLGKLDGTAAQMLARANDLAKLEQALRPPKARGGFGELLLENLLRDRLPATAYAMQHGFSSGERVDAVVRVGRLIPVDSKFPLDNFHRMIDARSDEERGLYRKAFTRDVKGKIDDIAVKYIRPDEGTFDFAFMYVPVESVYYELACSGDTGLLEYANERRVFPVSPNTFAAYLQLIVLGMRSMQVEERAHEVMAYVAGLAGDFGRFKDEFELVGKHLGHAQTTYARADKRLGKLETKLDRAIEDDDVPAVTAEPRAIEAA